MSAEQTISERIEAVLAEHTLASNARQCRCGQFRINYASHMAWWDQHAAHVAAALLAAGLVQEVRAEGAREALREAADTIDDAQLWRWLNATRGAAAWLNDRADSIGQRQGLGTGGEE